MRRAKGVEFLVWLGASVAWVTKIVEQTVPRECRSYSPGDFRVYPVRIAGLHDPGFHTPRGESTHIAAEVESLSCGARNFRHSSLPSLLPGEYEGPG